MMLPAVTFLMTLSQKPNKMAAFLGIVSAIKRR